MMKNEEKNSRQELKSVCVRGLSVCQKSYLVRKQAAMSTKAGRHVSLALVIGTLISDKMREEAYSCASDWDAWP